LTSKYHDYQIYTDLNTFFSLTFYIEYSKSYIAFLSPFTTNLCLTFYHQIKNQGLQKMNISGRQVSLHRFLLLWKFIKHCFGILRADFFFYAKYTFLSSNGAHSDINFYVEHSKITEKLGKFLFEGKFFSYLDIVKVVRWPLLIQQNSWSNHSNRIVINERDWEIQSVRMS